MTRKTVVSRSDESRGKSRGCRSSELSMPLRFVINKSDYGVQCIARTRCRALSLTTVRGEPWRSWVSVSELTFGPSRPLFVQPNPMFRAGLTEPARNCVFSLWVFSGRRLRRRSYRYYTNRADRPLISAVEAVTRGPAVRRLDRIA